MKCFFCQREEIVIKSMDLVINEVQRGSGVCDSNECEDKFDDYMMTDTLRHPLFFCDELTEYEWQIILRELSSDGNVHANHH